MRKEIKLIQEYQLYGTKVEPNPQAGRVYNPNGLCPTLDSCNGGNRMPKIIVRNDTKQGWLEAYLYDGVDISSRMPYHRGNVQPQMAHIIDTKGGDGHGVVVRKKVNGMETDKLTVRRLTPKECWRLQGFAKINEDGTFDDSLFEKAEKVNSNTQLYKQAGNSITVDVLCNIFKNLLF